MDQPASRAADQAAPDTAAAPPPAGDALSTVHQVIELADGLSDVADRLHQRILDELGRHPEGGFPAGLQASARALLDDEMLLRQRANTLYADAASHVIAGLGQPQARLAELTAEAAQKLRRIGRIAEATSLVASVLALAGAVISVQPGAVLDALEALRVHSDALDALAPPP